MDLSTQFDSRGYTYAHEHLHIDLSPFKQDLDCRLDCYALLVDEMRTLVSKGVLNLVEVTNRYMGRNPQFMLDLMQESGINILASTGYYQQEFYPPHVAQRSAQQLAQEMIDEIEQGIDGTELRASVIAEIGSSEGTITPTEEKVFHAAALAHLATGKPISTHTSFSTMGLEQLRLLTGYGVSAEHIVIGHCDLRDQWETLLRILDTGALIQFDTIGKNNYYPDEKRVATLLALAQRGLSGQVMLSMDITRRSHLAANEGPGFSYLIDTFIPMLLQAGIHQRDIDLMLRDNPNTFFKG
ncbi:Phosphotriesterase homology protein [Serratia quinivorans]|jgi:phosphotriesterase-related protein|uniref:phosphotriesterase-related protein n=1 Tax=Serratia quinivorans TaxID=137545 RepID=UPI002178AF92|nr:phosphotriesterase-related protein [Serratia quinivorans]CAI1004020.1 Phosphotriesterase homology protein [Serratia quinivorans]CAI1082894.1 Phosphotriesterase homology protein [Serratia quinivorans]CAI1762447.1 Phosphotriesterase homology protein [Serratia quinivorans]